MCIYCRVGLRLSCECTDKPQLSFDTSEHEIEKRKGSGEGRDWTSDDEITDVKSTGRKRAAVLYPLSKDSDCEWRFKANCGGGRFAILGCLEGKQVNRHHGPDKDTLNNGRGNVHRVCADCHNLWHAKNDPGYKWEAEKDNSQYALHAPVDMTDEDKGKAFFVDAQRKKNRSPVAKEHTHEED